MRNVKVKNFLWHFRRRPWVPTKYFAPNTQIPPPAKRKSKKKGHQQNFSLVLPGILLKRRVFQEIFSAYAPVRISRPHFPAKLSLPPQFHISRRSHSQFYSSFFFLIMPTITATTATAPTTSTFGSMLCPPLLI